MAEVVRFWNIILMLIYINEEVMLLAIFRMPYLIFRVNWRIKF